MGISGPDSLLWRVIDKRIKAFIAKHGVELIPVQALAVGAGVDAGKVRVRDPEGGTTRDVYYPQTNPNYEPAVDEWMWALSKEGGLTLLSPPTAEGSVSWDDILGKPSSFATTWTDVSGKPSTFPADTHNFWSTKHPDVDATDTPAGGDVATFDATSSKWKAAPVPAGGSTDWASVTGKPSTFPPDTHNLWSTKHPDVDAADTPANGDVITWDNTASKWKATPPPAAGGNHNLWSSTHPDVDTADTPAGGDVITWDSTASKWTAGPIPAGGSVSWASITGKPSTFPPDTHNFWGTKHPDVDATDTPANGDVVTWDSTASKWKASAPAGGGGSLTWNALTLTGSWTNVGSPYDAVSYSKDAQGIVRLRGAVNYPASFTDIATLPAGYRPTGDVVFPAMTPGSNNIGHIRVRPTGVMEFEGGSPGTGIDVVLNNIWFTTS